MNVIILKILKIITGEIRKSLCSLEIIFHRQLPPKIGFKDPFPSLSQKCRSFVGGKKQFLLKHMNNKYLKNFAFTYKNDFTNMLENIIFEFQNNFNNDNDSINVMALITL